MTPGFLALEAQAAAATGDHVGDVSARLRLVVALVREGDRDGARRILVRAEAESDGVVELALERALARAALDRSGALQELERVLADRPDPDAWWLLAEARSVQGSWEKADAAYALAMQHATPATAARIALCAAENRIRHGRDARPLLRRATGATSELVRLAAHQLLAGLELRHGDASASLEHAAAAGDIARARRNWFALSCATLDAEAAWAAQGQPEAGVAILHGTLAYVRQQGDPGVLLLARLVELREAATRPG